VPLRVLVPVALPWEAETIPEPGAKRSTQAPKFEKEERTSDEVVAPTVIASAVEARDFRQASSPSFPAETLAWMPATTMPRSARFSSSLLPPPSEKFTTAGPRLVFTTQSIAAIIPLYEPRPSQPRTRTDTSRTLFATP
jgi:hypothetical protein